MRIETSKGKSLSVNWAETTKMFGIDVLMISFWDDRPFSEFEKDFEGCDFFYRTSEEQGDKIFDGFTKLISVNRPDMFNLSEVELRLVRES